MHVWSLDGSSNMGDAAAVSMTASTLTPRSAPSKSGLPPSNGISHATVERSSDIAPMSKTSTTMTTITPTTGRRITATTTDAGIP